MNLTDSMRMALRAAVIRGHVRVMATNRPRRAGEIAGTTAHSLRRRGLLSRHAHTPYGPFDYRATAEGRRAAMERSA